MEVILPATIEERLVAELAEAGNREIGGVLMGEHVGPGRFRIVDLTVQRSGGSLATFLRAVADAIASLGRFFRRTGRDYKRFNYLGEWHSHPSFLPEPSAKDLQTMLEIATDEAVGANFVVLLIIRLIDNALTGSATVFLPDATHQPISLVLEGKR